MMMMISKRSLVARVVLLLLFVIGYLIAKVESWCAVVGEWVSGAERRLGAWD
jgi:hypothetical protein